MRKKNFDFRKTYCIREGRVSSLSVENILSHSTEKFRWGTLRCIRKLRVSKNFMNQRGGGEHVLRQKLLSHSTENFRRVTLRCFRKIRVSQNFMHKKWISLNSVENFCSHSAEKFRGYPFNDSGNLGYRKLLCKIGVSRFSIEIFLSHSTKNFVGEHFGVSENFVYRKILCIRSGYH